jgi:N-acetylmuramoyl-L-alanine amidase
MGNKRVFLLLGLIWIFFIGNVFSQPDPQVEVCGQEILFQNFLVRNGVFYVAASDAALQEVAHFFNHKIEYNASLNQITVLGSKELIFIFPSGLSVDGKNVPLTHPSFLENRQWYLSLNTLGEALGANVSYDQERNIWYLDPYVTGVVLQVTPNGLSFTVQATGPIEPTLTTLPNPNRIMMEIPYAALGKNIQVPQVQSQDNPLVGNVNITQENMALDRVQMVIPLVNSDVHWDVQANQNRNAFTLNIAPNLPLQTIVENSQAQKFDEGQSENGAGQNQGDLSQTQNALQTQKTPGGPPTSLEAVSFVSTSDGGFVANIKVSGKTSFEWHQLKWPDDRLFIDFENCRQKVLEPPVFNSPLLNEFRIAQFQKTPYPIARLVLALHDFYQVSIHPNATGLVIRVSNVTQKISMNRSGSGVTGNPTTVAAVAPLPRVERPNGITIVLDPGHGGKDTGAMGTQLVEKDVTLDIALKLRALLVQQGFNVLMTRTTDRECLGYEGTAVAELQCRADVANKNHASLFVSLHVNADYASWPHGISTYWYKAIDLPLAVTLQRYLGTETGFANRGVLRARFYVLRKTVVPAVLVEMGFITNPNDQAMLEQETVRDKIVQSLDQGIEAYAGMKVQSHL